MNKIFRFIQAGALGIALSAMLPACTDDHFDVQDGGDAGSGAIATQTLWDQIKANPELSRFATLAEKTPYFKDETHPVANYTFKDVLNGTQVLTVFAPTDKAFTDAEYNSLLALGESEPYELFLRMTGNHIVRSRYNVTGTNPNGKPYELTFINGKRATFDCEKGLLRDIKLQETNIPALNGTLHTMDEQAVFAYNVYEYLKAHKDTYAEMLSWITEHDTIYFNADMSAESGSDADGNPIYADSIYSRANPLFRFYFKSRYYNSDYTETDKITGKEWFMSHKVFGANFENEDSVWAVAILSDAVWNASVNNMKGWYNYAPAYTDKEKLSSKAAPELTKLNADSLASISMRMDLTSAAVFNVKEQLRKKHVSGELTAEKFLNTNFTKLFNCRLDTFELADGGDVKDYLFGSTTPISISNGLLYPVNSWKFMDSQLKGKRDVVVEVRSNTIYKPEDRGSNEYTIYPISNQNSAWVQKDHLGAVGEDDFMYVRNDGTTRVEIKLIDRDENRQVLSGLEYDIQVVMVPDFYRQAVDTIRLDTIDGGYVKQNKLRLQIYYNDGGNFVQDENNERYNDDSKASDTWNFEYAGERVDTITVGSITFPYSYRNLYNTYPTAVVSSRALRSADRNTGFQYPFCIDRIILKAKE